MTATGRPTDAGGVCVVRVVEGNYLLLDYFPWSLLKELFDERWFVQVDVAEAMQVGAPPHKVVGFSHGSDHGDSHEEGRRKYEPVRSPALPAGRTRAAQ